MLIFDGLQNGSQMLRRPGKTFFARQQAVASFLSLAQSNILGIFATLHEPANITSCIYNKKVRMYMHVHMLNVLPSVCIANILPNHV